MRKKTSLPAIAAFLFCLTFCANAQIPNTTFGDKRNQISVHAGISHNDRFEELFLAAISYSQPNDFFRLPGRRNIEFLTAAGTGEYSKYNQHLIFGLSQDAMTPGFRRAYAGINLGMYIKPNMTERIDSRFTFGQRYFIGFRVTDHLALEIFRRHFSNGDLTDINRGQNFIGLSGMWIF